jgi:hypothetical protein
VSGLCGVVSARDCFEALLFGTDYFSTSGANRPEWSFAGRLSGTETVTTLQYQRLDDMVDAVGLPKESLCPCCRNRQFLMVEQGAARRELSLL